MSTLERAKQIAAEAKQKGRTVALCNGAFDLLHVGHLRYLAGAKAIADVLIVAVNSDAAVRKQKGDGRPRIPENERLELVAALRCVDAAFIFETPTVEPILRALLPTYHCKGTDYTETNVPEVAIDHELGIIVKITGDAKDHSTTALLKK